MAVEWGLAEEIFSGKIIFFALTPVFSVEFFSQSTAVFSKSVENVVNIKKRKNKLTK